MTFVYSNNKQKTKSKQINNSIGIERENAAINRSLSNVFKQWKPHTRFIYMFFAPHFHFTNGKSKQKLSVNIKIYGHLEIE